MVHNKRTSATILLRAGIVAVAFLVLAAFTTQAHTQFYDLNRFLQAEASDDVPMLSFSRENAFVAPGDTLELLLPDYLDQHVSIRYTLDGSLPDENASLYEGPIVLDPDQLDGRGGWYVRAQVVQGGTKSEVYERTYLPQATAVLGDGIFIVLLYGEEEDFYSEETGILARGAADADAAWEREDLPLNKAGDERGNYFGRGAEWERPVRVEILDWNGNRLLRQDAGVRVTGGYSRASEQKSLRLYARGKYDEGHTKFSIVDIFPQQVSSDGSMTPVAEFNHLDLRNGGNDYPATMLNDAGMRLLAYDAGYATIGVPVPAVTYLNGAFYGFAWLQPDYDEKNLTELCNLQNPENIQILEEAEHFAASGAFPDAKDDYLAFYDFALGDMTVQRNADQLEEMADMDNLLFYYALELYCNNQDWPHNNYKVWRYVDATEEEKASNPYADGRWRFLFYDTDFGFSTIVDGVEGFDWALAHEQSPMLASILKNTGFRDRFVSIWCRLLATTLEADTAQGIVFGAKDRIEPEMQYREQTDPDQKIFDREYRQVMYVKLEDFLSRRPGDVRAQITNYFGLSRQYNLDLQSPEAGATVWLNGYAYREGEGLAAPFYAGAGVTLTYELAEGYTFLGWEVNGALVPDDTLVLGPFVEEQALPGDESEEGAIQEALSSYEEPAEQEEEVAVPNQTVRLVLGRQGDAQAIISEVSYRNEWNWIAFSNIGGEPYDISGAYLEKNGERVYVFPAEILEQDERFLVLEQSNELAEENRGEYIADFKFRRGDVLRLYSPGGQLLDEVTLPTKNTGYVYRHSPFGKSWVWTPADELEAS